MVKTHIVIVQSVIGIHLSSLQPCHLCGIKELTSKNKLFQLNCSLACASVCMWASVWPYVYASRSKCPMLSMSSQLGSLIISFPSELQFKNDTKRRKLKMGEMWGERKGMMKQEGERVKNRGGIEESPCTQKKWDCCLFEGWAISFSFVCDRTGRWQTPEHCGAIWKGSGSVTEHLSFGAVRLQQSGIDKRIKGMTEQHQSRDSRKGREIMQCCCDTRGRAKAKPRSHGCQRWCFYQIACLTNLVWQWSKAIEQSKWTSFNRSLCCTFRVTFKWPLVSLNRHWWC